MHSTLRTGIPAARTSLTISSKFRRANCESLKAAIWDFVHWLSPAIVAIEPSLVAVWTAVTDSCAKCADCRMISSDRRCTQEACQGLARVANRDLSRAKFVFSERSQGSVAFFL